MKKQLLYWPLGIIVIFLDQLTKYWAETMNAPISLLGNWFRLSYAENTGIAFSLPLEGLLLQVFTVVFITAIIIFASKTRAGDTLWKGIAYTVLLSGAFGNAIDRFFRGYVIDFISVGNFPIFNIADSAVTIGIVMLLVWELRKNGELRIEN